MSKAITVYPGTYSKLGKHVLAKKLNISMAALDDSVAIYKLNHNFQIIGHGRMGIDLVDRIIDMIAERSNN